ncbi:protein TRIGALACTOSYLDIACYLGLYCEROL 1, chloroplastic-like [Phragmites australis]|uniref:protein TRIGALACTOSYLDIACYLGLYCEROL 1, chloroplastic-like n=1 Tax=Phragmites australis TaxID=29695 RepID=UPI002D7683F6|nr:protein TRIGALACTOSYLDIACYLGLYCEROL 1, chloroplastic-like [Phragmites australis]XP_062185841.1 protein TRIGALACTOSYLDIACYLGLYCEROL 1, chloroplastic-like [Phragmites australis]XP_062185842.1 protein TRIGALACTOSYLDIACYLGLYCEROL 1, chloroplastic-like [Phragmites australis]
MSSAAALLLRPTSATAHPLLHMSSASPNPKYRFLRFRPSRRRLPVPRLSLTPTTASNNSPPSPPHPDASPAPPAPPTPSLFAKWSPPRAIWRGLSALLLAGQVFHRVLTGRVHRRNLLAQLRRVGPGSAGVALLTAAFVGMAFTIQFVREFTRLGLHRSVGGVLALALARELSPVVTAVVAAGRVGSAFAAELGTMQVSEQTDTLRVLGAQPVDYLVVPRVLACVLALPVLTLISFALGLASSAFLADSVFGVSVSVILESARRALRPWDLISSLLKSQVFGAIIAVVSCAWGVTTHGGAKGVGESTTSAVVVSLVGIFIADFALSCLFFQGAGDSLKYAMG